MRKLFAFLLLAAAVGAGCLSLGNNSRVDQSRTVGRQLMDLKEARDNGAITPEEYNRLRVAIIEQPINTVVR